MSVLCNHVGHRSDISVLITGDVSNNLRHKITFEGMTTKSLNFHDSVTGKIHLHTKIDQNRFPYFVVWFV